MIEFQRDGILETILENYEVQWIKEIDALWKYVLSFDDKVASHRWICTTINEYLPMIAELTAEDFQQMNVDEIAGYLME